MSVSMDASHAAQDGKTTFAYMLNDFMFKRAFGNREIMMEFLNMVIPDVGIVDIEYIPTEHFGETEKDRKAIFDLMCRTESGEEIIVEMQNAEQKFFRDRAILYTTNPIAKQGREYRERMLGLPDEEKGAWNYELKPVYIVAILNFHFGHRDDIPKDRYLNRYRIREDETGEAMSDKVRYVLIELPRFKKSESECKTLLEKTIYSIKNMHECEDVPTGSDEKFLEYLYKLSKMNNFTDEELTIYLKEQEMMWDYQNTIDYAEEKGFNRGLAEGREDGREDGRAEEKVEIAANLIRLGIRLEQIAEATGLTIEKLNDLQQQ